MDVLKICKIIEKLECFIRFGDFKNTDFKKLVALHETYFESSTKILYFRYDSRYSIEAKWFFPSPMKSNWSFLTEYVSNNFNLLEI